MPHAYIEDQLVDQPAIGLFAEPGSVGVPLRLELERLNYTLPPEPINAELKAFKDES